VSNFAHVLLYIASVHSAV